MFNSFPSIEGFHNVRKNVKKYGWVEPGVLMSYRGKIKLHGTNAGIVITPDGKVYPQSRSRIISVGEDNLGFAAWVETTKDFWRSFADKKNKTVMTVFGEWFGPGIQKGVACNKIDRKSFAIFAAQIGSSSSEDSYMISDATALEDLFLDSETPETVFVLPWHTYEIELNFYNDEQLQKAVDDINKLVDEVEANDPWIKEVFGVDGTGEGLVFVLADETIPREIYKRFTFKAKGEKHRVVKSDKAVQIDPIVMNSITQFVDKVLAEARFEQGAREINRGELSFDQKLIGPFIGWVSKDVAKEHKQDAEDNDLDWKLISKEISSRARDWYLNQLSKV